MKEALIRTTMLLGSSAIEQLATARVAVFGLGGVGGCVVEGLVRAGIGALDLIDNDTVDVSNLNRQIIATTNVIGQYKTDVCAARVHAISPDCQVQTHRTFFLPETASAFDFHLYDYVVDAIDTVTGKLSIIQCAQVANVPVISCMGTGNKVHPEQLLIGDIYHTSICPLARTMRKECRQRGFSPFKVLYSTEPPLRPAFMPEQNSNRRSIPGSVSFVPTVAGFMIAGEVIKDIAKYQVS